MAHESYASVVRSFWTDPRVRQPLTPVEKLVFLYLCTSPHGNMIGMYPCPLMYVARETGVREEDIEAMLAPDGPLEAFVLYDRETEEVLILGAGKHQVGRELGTTDKRRGAIRRLVEAVHSKPLRRAFLTRYEHWNLGLPVPEHAAAASDGSPIEGASEGLLVNGKGHRRGTIHNRTDHNRTEQNTAAAEKPRRVRTTREKPDPEPAPSWVARFGTAWEPRGKPQHGRIGRVLKPLVDEHGEYQVWLAWEGYLGELEGKPYASPEHFAANYTLYRSKWAVIVDHDGSPIGVPDGAPDGWLPEPAEVM